nr:methyl-accepting chemotaxis protein [Telmatospirillum sp. J64-1]
MPERILALASKISELATLKIDEIQTVTKASNILALNALIEASRAGEAGRGFAVVASEVKEISQRVTAISLDLRKMFQQEVVDLQETAQQVRGSRLADLAGYAIEVMDRNLYERSCDVRWWATDSAIVDLCARTDQAAADHASRRLGVILGAYTVYLDLWVADRSGRVIATGRPGRYPQAPGCSVAGEEWFRQALSSRSGSEFSVADISRNAQLGGRAVATYAAAVRRDGAEDGPVIGVLGIFFDWESQARTIVQSLRLTDEERQRTRALLVDSRHRVIAASDSQGLLSEVYPLRTGNASSGSYVDDKGHLVGFSLTPGYETYRGLGWYGVVEQAPR